jgi:hypothetical protein
MSNVSSSSSVASGITWVPICMVTTPGWAPSSFTSSFSAGTSRSHGAMLPATTIAAPLKISSGVTMSCSLTFS